MAIQVPPFAAGAHAGLGSTFAILGFPDSSDHDVVYIEEAAGRVDDAMDSTPWERTAAGNGWREENRLVDLYALAVSLTQVSGWLLLLGVGVPGLIWLLGLIVALRGTAPPDRARIIDAYGRAFPGWRGRPTRHSPGGRRTRAPR